ncbi:hypothetical protein P153DRAFT_366347 [Dothidotthia symphoricarpi CBS 119687]|uniref:Uncharacterized protein n=1 Tax=Dothidotthia symphoricarpi CBS 119687 TaxID=1392245 RepID=A0A6A6ADD2_9PLEO|nr:uncharacterized protein P153DRAFT_366347 [Dothidotthia symphoricarpi CBS 119687]KAF2129839.1 hypothetical protein P153DRAFT_366347 [Dothidotthia symphoricarpi CBS 119687]
MHATAAATSTAASSTAASSTATKYPLVPKETQRRIVRPELFQLMKKTPLIFSSSVIRKRSTGVECAAACDSARAALVYDADFRERIEIMAWKRLCFEMPNVQPWNKLSDIPASVGEQMEAIGCMLTI